jgi:hypothetical protein
MIRGPNNIAPSRKRLKRISPVLGKSKPLAEDIGQRRVY